MFYLLIQAIFYGFGCGDDIFICKCSHQQPGLKNKRHKKTIKKKQKNRMIGGSVWRASDAIYYATTLRA